MSDKISTQNMSTKSGAGLSFTKKAGNPNDVSPMPIKVLTSFTEQEQQELKDIFHSVLQEYGLVRKKDK